MTGTKKIAIFGKNGIVPPLRYWAGLIKVLGRAD